MPDLEQSLQGRDLGHLNIIAQLWGIDLKAPDARVGVQRLAPELLKTDLVQEVVDALPIEARHALDDLLNNDGRLPWALFTRRYGGVRDMGSGRRDRERPYLKPESTAEILWYRALIARSFFDAPSGPEEFAYIPEDLVMQIPLLAGRMPAPLGRVATPAERTRAISANDRLLDYATTLLAALRLGLPDAQIQVLFASQAAAAYPLTPVALQALLLAAGLVDAEGIPQPEPVRAFLEAGRGEALAHLAKAWLASPSYDDLRLIPTLKAEGEWKNDPLAARRAVLDFLANVPGDKWWSLGGFIHAIKQAHPDFQRPAGDYDSWYIRSVSSGEYLRGVNHWEDVEGALIRAILCGPMHWLGIVDLAGPEPPAGATFTAQAFRFTAWSAALLKGEAPTGLPLEEESLAVTREGRLRAPRLAPRAARYLVARFCLWEDEQVDAYRYRLAPASLERARSQGLTLAHLLALLRKHAKAVPPTLVRSLERWEAHGAEIRLEQVTVLRLASPDILQKLRASPANRFLGDLLGSTAVIIQSGAAGKVMAALAELGYLGDAEIEREE